MSDINGLVEIRESRKNDVLVLYLKGRLDAVSSPTAEHHVFDYINNGVYKIVLNFANIDYLSSAGMRMLLSVTKKLKALSGNLVVCCIKSNVMEVLKMSGFDHVLDIAKTEDDALRHF